MIDEIIDRILLEARGKDKEDVVAAIYATMMELDQEIIKSMENLREEERRGVND